VRKHFFSEKTFPPIESSQSPLFSASAFGETSAPLPCSSLFPQQTLPLVCSGNPGADVRKHFFSEKTFPPIRSVGEWGAYQLIGLFIGPYLDF